MAASPSFLHFHSTFTKQILHPQQRTGTAPLWHMLHNARIWLTWSFKKTLKACFHFYDPILSRHPTTQSNICTYPETFSLSSTFTCTFKALILIYSCLKPSKNTLNRSTNIKKKKSVLLKRYIVGGLYLWLFSWDVSGCNKHTSRNIFVT